MSWPTPWQQRLDALHGLGLNAVGVADGSDYERFLPGCRSVVVLGSGGPALWEALLEAVRAEAEIWTAQQHPLDAWVKGAVQVLDPDPPPQERRWVFCGALDKVQPDFRHLAEAAGLGWKSKLGVLLHPEYGPWLGLRAACFTTEVLPVSARPSGPSPCEACPAPCVDACPTDAMSRSEGWDVGRCAAFHTESPRCHRRCDARGACPVGVEHRYSDLERLYHTNRVLGRPAVAHALGFDDPHEGVGPAWARWAGLRRD